MVAIGSDLALAPLDVQAAALESMIRDDPDLMAILALVRDQALADGWLTSGAIYQTVWNRLTGRPRRHGIKDYDVIYFDGADLSYAAEDAVIRRVEAAARPLGLPIEVRNQARVHLWFEQRFGFPVPPIAASAESLVRYASTSHAVAARLDGSGRIELLAPFGLRDVFALHIRPNRALPNGASHDAKARRCQSVWPEVTVEWW